MLTILLVAQGVEAFVFEGAVAHWRYLGAAEDSDLDDTWFSARAARAPRGVFAARASRCNGSVSFPLVWREAELPNSCSGSSLEVPAVDRTAYYRGAVTRQLRLAPPLIAYAEREGVSIGVILREAMCTEEVVAIAEFGAGGMQFNWPHEGCIPLAGVASLRLPSGVPLLMEVLVPCEAAHIANRESSDLIPPSTRQLGRTVLIDVQKNDNESIVIGDM